MEARRGYYLCVTQRLAGIYYKKNCFFHQGEN